MSEWLISSWQLALSTRSFGHHLNRGEQVLSNEGALMCYLASMTLSEMASRSYADCVRPQCVFGPIEHCNRNASI